MYGQMTAGSWIYIGTQGILQGTYETFAAVAAKRFGGSLAGHGHADRRPRRDGRRAAARGDAERRRRPRRRMRPEPDRAAARGRLPGRGGRLPRRRALAGRGGPGRPPAAVDRRARQRRGGPAGAAGPRRDRRHRHRPDLGPRPAGLPAARGHDGRLAGAEGQGPDRLYRAGAGVDGRARRGDGRLPGRRRGGLRLRQLDPGGGPRRRVRPRVRLPRVRPGLHPAAVLRGQGAVPLGRALRRRGRHRRHRQGRPRPVPGERDRDPVDQAREREGQTPGPARPDLLARARRAGARRRSGSTRWSPPARCGRRS